MSIVGFSIAFNVRYCTPKIFIQMLIPSPPYVDIEYDDHHKTHESQTYPAPNAGQRFGLDVASTVWKGETNTVERSPHG